MVKPCCVGFAQSFQDLEQHLEMVILFIGYDVYKTFTTKLFVPHSGDVQLGPVDHGHALDLENLREVAVGLVEQLLNLGGVLVQGPCCLVDAACLGGLRLEALELGLPLHRGQLAGS